MAYCYHIRILKHFTGKKTMNLPFYIHRSLGKIEDKFQGKKHNFENSLFHFGLIKLLVLEELKRKDLDWEAFLLSTGFSVEVVGSPHAKKKTPSPLQKETKTRLSTSKENK